jgi:hypothetical protein
MGLGIHVQEEGEEVVEQNLPLAGHEAVGPLGGVMVVGRGGRYELVAEDGGRPLAAPRSYHAQGGVLRERRGHGGGFSKMDKHVAYLVGASRQVGPRA